MESGTPRIIRRLAPGVKHHNLVHAAHEWLARFHRGNVAAGTMRPNETDQLLPCRIGLGWRIRQMLDLAR